MQGHVPNIWDLKERSWLQAEEEPGRSSNWDAKVSEVKPPLNQTLCILVKFTRDLRPHFQSVFFFFLRCTFFDNCSPYGIYGPNSLWQLGIAFFFLCWPQPHHSNPPEQHQSSLEFWQKSFLSTTAAWHEVHITWTSPPQAIFATEFLLPSLWCTIWGEQCREASTAVLSSVWKIPQSQVPVHATFVWKNPK